MADEHGNPAHNVGSDPLEAEPSAGRGGKDTDPIPEQMESAERLKDSEHPVTDEESQEERGATAAQSPGHVGSPEQVSKDSQEGHPI